MLLSGAEYSLTSGSLQTGEGFSFALRRWIFLDGTESTSNLDPLFRLQLDVEPAPHLPLPVE